MKKLLILGAVALFAIPVGQAWAVPMCDGPDFSLRDANGKPIYDETQLASDAEDQLRGQGIDANNTRFWNGCIQSFVRENGHETLHYYDPDTLREIPVN